MDNLTNSEYSTSPLKALTKGYILALAIIAVMSITVHVIMDRILWEQDLAANIVSKSTAESKQVHRIIILATEYFYTKNENILTELSDENATLKNIHKSLTDISKGEYKHSSAANIITDIYFNEPTKLDSKLSAFTTNVDNFITKAHELGEADPQLYDSIVTRQFKGALTSTLASALVMYEQAFIGKIDRLRMVQVGAVIIICITLLLEAFAIFMPLVMRVQKYAGRLEEISMTDMLTGVGNRRYFINRSEQEARRAARLSKELCICMIDIDYFKKVNDTYGHAAGDYVLREFVEIVKSAIRLEDEIARVGGEEFVLLLPASDIKNALIVTERVRQRLEERPFVLPETGESIKMTASFGLAQVDVENHEDVQSVMAKADDALYVSKENGRNRVTYIDFANGDVVEADVNVSIKTSNQDKIIAANT